MLSRAQSFQRPFQFFVAVLAVALFTTCTSEETPHIPPIEPPIELTIGLSASSGAAASRVLVTGIPDNIDDVYAVVTPVSPRNARTEHGFGVIEKVDDDYELVVPIHPETPMQGGIVNVSVTNGSNVTSNVVQLDIGALPPAPGAFANLVGEVQAMLDAWLTANGKTRQELRDTDPEDLDARDVQVLFVHNLLDHPDNENSLAALASGDIPEYDDGEEPLDRDVFDSLIALSELSDYANERAATFDTLTTPDVADTTGALFARAATRMCIEAPRFSIDADDCYKLAEVMRYQTQLELEAASAAEKYLDSIQNTILSAIGKTPAGKIAGGIATVYWAISTIEDSHKQLYPSEFISDETQVTVDPAVFPEDFDQPGQWSDFKVSAGSTGWNFEKALFTALQKAYKAGKGIDANDAIDYTPKPKPAFTGVQDKYNKMVKNRLTKDVKKGIQGDIQDEIDLEYCPQTWHAIKCDEFAQGVNPDGGLDVEPNPSTNYEPTEVGTALLRVETMEVFGPGNSTAETVQIETEQLEVRLDPFQATADVEESITFFVNSLGAQDASVDWSVEWPPGNAGYLIDGGDQAAVGTPSDPWQTPFAVKIKSTSNTGLREGMVDSDPREDTALVSWAGGPTIMITPAAQCIENNQDVTLTAVVEGLPEPTIIWTKEEGFATFVPSGETCVVTGIPMGTDNTRMKATVEELPELFAYADIRTSACNCNFTVAVGGWNTTGFDIAHQYGFGAIQWYIENPDPDSDVLLGMSLFADPPLEPGPGGEGDFRISAVYFDGFDTWRIDQADTAAAATMTILEHTTSAITGSVSGVLVQRNDPNDPELITSSININMSFRSGHFSGGWPCQ